MKESGFAKLARVLDGLLEVIVTAKHAAKMERGVASRARTLFRLAVAARREVRREAEASLLGDNARVVQSYEELLSKLQSRTRELTAGKWFFSVDTARAATAALDARCGEWLCQQFAANGGGGAYRAGRVAQVAPALAALRAIERSTIFQRALLLDQLRLAPHGHDRDSLSYGSTPFASFASVLAHPACTNARRACYCRHHVLVVGASSGSLCLFASALGLRAVGIEVLPTLVAVARKLAASYPDIGLKPDHFCCADARDHAVLTPLLKDAAIVVLTSSCWAADLVASLIHQLKGPALQPEAIIIDYAPNLHLHPETFLHQAQIVVPVNWCLDSLLPIHVYSKVSSPIKSDLDNYSETAAAPAAAADSPSLAWPSSLVSSPSRSYEALLSY